MKWFIAINLQFAIELGDMKFIFSFSIADVELLLHRIKKHTFIRVLQKYEFEPHLTYVEEMEVLIDIGFSQPKRVGRESK